MQEIPTKNYIILGILTIGVIVVCLIFSNAYKNNNTEVYTSVVKDVVNEIQYEDLENYLQENPDVVLYINDSTKKSSRETDKEFKKLIIDNSIQQYVVYIERDNNIVKEYDLDSNNSIFIAYQGGKITEVFSKEIYSDSEIESFLVRNKVIEND